MACAFKVQDFFFFLMCEKEKNLVLRVLSVGCVLEFSGGNGDHGVVRLLKNCSLRKKEKKR